jgi:uncharacterized protein (TIGR02145 family)
MNKAHKITLTASIILALAFTFTGCGGGDDMPCLTCPDDYYDGGSGQQNACPNAVTGNNTVACGGQTYRTVKIGTQTWMAENLNYNATGSKCYDKDPANCAKYGRLYDWATAMGIDKKYNTQTWGGSDVKHRGICPSGWHIPNDGDWDVLMTAVGGSSTAGTYLKATSGWNNNGNGTDAYSFSALPGGDGSSDGSFGSVGYHGYWWSSCEYGSYGAYVRDVHYDYEYAGWNGSSKGSLFSVRCVED